MAKPDLFGHVESDAMFSPCRVWRWALIRSWSEVLPSVAFIGLNPSTADETLNDPTITRCIQFAKDWGFGSFVMLNLFGLRSTDPNGLKGVSDPVGPENDKYIDLMIEQGRTIVAAWGSHKCVEKLIVPRAAEVLKRIPNSLCLGTNADGMPKHPLYLKRTTKPVPYER